MTKPNRAKREPGDPTYLHHKPSGQAITIVRTTDGKRKQIYLGCLRQPGEQSTVPKDQGSAHGRRCVSARADIPCHY